MPSTLKFAAVNLGVAVLSCGLWAGTIAAIAVITDRGLGLFYTAALSALVVLGLGYAVWRRLAQRLLPTAAAAARLRVARLGSATTLVWFVLLPAWILPVSLQAFSALGPSGYQESFKPFLLAGLTLAIGLAVTRVNSLAMKRLTNALPTID